MAATNAWPERDAASQMSSTSRAAHGGGEAAVQRMHHLAQLDLGPRGLPGEADQATVEGAQGVGRLVACLLGGDVQVQFQVESLLGVADGGEPAHRRAVGVRQEGAGGEAQRPALAHRTRSAAR
jgi:hypothetical protein